MTKSTHPAAEFLDALGKGVLDLLYPPKCVVCGEVQPLYLCVDCRSRISAMEGPLCRKCGLPTDGEPCAECRRTRFAFTRARAVGVYDGALRTAIHRLKYGGVRAVAPELGDLLTAHLAGSADSCPGAASVLPMPIHSSRRRERGFNQSLLLAGPVSDFLGVPLLEDVLIRVRASRPQVDLPVDERMNNVRGVFKVERPEMITGTAVLLVDDVMTTGSTADEAARALRHAGASAIYVLTLARSC